PPDPNPFHKLYPWRTTGLAAVVRHPQFFSLGPLRSWPVAILVRCNRDLDAGFKERRLHLLSLVTARCPAGLVTGNSVISKGVHLITIGKHSTVHLREPFIWGLLKLISLGAGRKVQALMEWAARAPVPRIVERHAKGRYTVLYHCQATPAWSFVIVHQ